MASRGRYGNWEASVGKPLVKITNMLTARIAENRIGTVSTIRCNRLRSQNLSTVTILENEIIYAAVEQVRFISNLINSICATLRNLWIMVTISLIAENSAQSNANCY